MRYGNLAELVLLDTRLRGRDKGDNQLVSAPPPLDPARTLLGEDQAAWMEKRLSSSNAQWKLICPQVMLGNF